MKSGSVANARLHFSQSVCAELFKTCPQLGRFTLRDEGRTIAIGKITKLYRPKVEILQILFMPVVCELVPAVVLGVS